ncbi:MAG: ATP-binding protein [Gammaproteobacteria bacterium]
MAALHGSHLLTWTGDQTLHSILESMAMMLGLMAGALALVRSYTTNEVNMLFLGIGFVIASLLDGHHLFVTSEYARFAPDDPSNSARWVWLNSRLFLSLMVAAGAAAWFYERRPDARYRIGRPFVFSISALLLLAATSVGTVLPEFQAQLPVPWYFFDTGATAAALLTALLLYARKGAWRQEALDFWLMMGIIAALAAQTDYHVPEDTMFFVSYFAAHGLKLLGYVFVLVGLTLSAYHLFKRAAANEAKDAFVATISHEIRTPLNAIGGSLALLESARLSQQEQELLSVAKESNDVLLGLVNNVLDFSRIEAGKLEAREADCHPAEIVDNVVHLLGVRAFRNHAFLSSSVDPKVAECIAADPRLIRQVLLNLVSNAIKYSPDGEVVIRLCVSDQRMLRFEVEDTGVGIPQAEQAKVFDEFSRALSRNSVAMSGTGLGLPISKRLVSLMGGRIGFSSRAGSGSVFWFSIPYKPINPEVLQPGAVGEFAGLRALLVGTREDLWQVISKRLKTAGIEACFENAGELAAQGVSTLECRGHFDLLFTTATFFRNGQREIQGRQWLVENFGDLADHLILLYSAQSITELDRSEVEVADYVLTTPILNSELWHCLQSLTGREIAHPEHRSWARAQEATDESLRGVRILLVEDSVANRTVESAMLHRMGCRVDEAGDGIEAVEAATRACYDIILMDLEMPRMDGYEAARRIRRLPGPAADTPIIAVTAHVMAGISRKCRLAGMDAYVVKPVDREKLVSAIREFVPRLRTMPGVADRVGELSIKKRSAH